MNKTALIIEREYLSRVRKKSFLLTTILVPLVIILFYAVIIYISLDKSDNRQRIAVIDEGNLFGNKSAVTDETITYTLIKNETGSAFIKKYKAQGYECFLYIPAFSIDAPGKFVLYSEKSTGLKTIDQIETFINQAIRNKRLQSMGVNPEEFEKKSIDAVIENRIDTKDGVQKNFAGISYVVSMLCGVLIYMMMIIYGTQVMRGVSEEKTNRIAEVVISSVKPFQLMTGKIIGIGAVGLTQFIIWLMLIFMMQSAIPLIFPGLMEQINQSANNREANVMVAETLQGLSSLPLEKIIFFFLFYFLGGYLTYASIFAAIGSVVSEDQQDAQQLVFPVLMPIILGFVILTKAVDDPNSSLAVFGSIFPLTSPIVMMGRITYDIPYWQIVSSMILLIGCFLLFSWITGKIYRIGILMYGKKPGWKEMMKWAFSKS